MKKNSRNLVISLATAVLFSFLFIFVANNKQGVATFDISLGTAWVFLLSLIVALSLAQRN
ncbi:MAG: hypothetical protein UX99_C0018G0006 [Candidatus Amesbacteria bacterium GW2011_GWB1_47_26]|uniref:Uncharacterized protein n=1 Tax=Candidatus Amesbacteria bacterium GW2011_GWC2_45_19 TaxID=1618366 RepID=A0A0G1PDA1_9BACT|nr:MAG: hypothetical protein UX05_C0001G0037 [Candidatus Amesbacteria bacterium GW2011_GWC2_45_19]KKU38569.1 MAG: hypothetical protein UX52_C0004G0039 [Candidatus Amesbacteria bacterium GW2011_GWA1_46_35]KKU69610.1 MAG: hypothetical protein UX93_C0001G0195 [Microgenomates group bacterium GW2011_GWC1_47_20]KKU74298.1 MAG: hypothetical protein UX99_C0018G0006 [Candidatus Amesbacteria bacterium GW2011_GWB1_47_26]KKU79603.1 MAG: hypothetical protein UY06_C0017G0012 [Candidatus Amesbacteria bacteriu